jgi:hypothetical protein
MVKIQLQLQVQGRLPGGHSKVLRTFQLHLLYLVFLQYLLRTAREDEEGTLI